MSNKNSAEAVLGIDGILFLIFLILKLTNNINWSWWWVTAPLWISFALVIIVLLITSMFDW